MERFPNIFISLHGCIVILGAVILLVLLLGLHFLYVELNIWQYSSLFCMLRIGLSHVRRFPDCRGGLWAVPRAEGLSCRGDSVAHSL